MQEGGHVSSWDGAKVKVLSFKSPSLVLQLRQEEPNRWQFFAYTLLYVLFPGDYNDRDLRNCSIIENFTLFTF